MNPKGDGNAVIVISDRDNVATALEALAPGRSVQVGAAAVVVLEPVPRGHKLALREIRAGEPVLKYGSAIGVASASIPAGAHVHTHNLASGRGRGDLTAPPPPGEARLAEPPDADPPDAEPADAEAPETPPSPAQMSHVEPAGRGRRQA